MLVALEGPLLITVIVKVTTSPIVVSLRSTTLITVKLTTGVTLTDTLLDLTVLFSFEVTFTTLVKVPLITGFKVIVNTNESPALINGIIKRPVSLS